MHCRSQLGSQSGTGVAGMLVTEMWIERIARELGMTPRAVRRVNMYDEGDKTHYGQLLEGCQVKACFEQVRAVAALGVQHQSSRSCPYTFQRLGVHWLFHSVCFHRRRRTVLHISSALPKALHLPVSVIR